MTPEDAELWKRVTEGVAPIEHQPKAVAIQPRAAVWAFFLRNPFDKTLDLHGMTLSQAHGASRQFLSQAYTQHRLKYVTVITGLSGPIRREFPLWIAQWPEVRRFETRAGGGSFKVYLKKH